MKKRLILLFNLFSIVNLAAQEIKWQPVILDEVLILSLPVGYIQTDTIIIDNETVAYSRTFQANTNSCILFISIDSTNIELKIHDRESAYISLEGIGEGVCSQYAQAGYLCERSDTTIAKIPIKKILFYKNQTDLALFGYLFRANNKTYRIFSTVSNNQEGGQRPSDLDILLPSIKFNSQNIKEYRFYTYKGN